MQSKKIMRSKIIAPLQTRAPWIACLVIILSLIGGLVFNFATAKTIQVETPRNVGVSIPEMDDYPRELASNRFRIRVINPTKKPVKIESVIFRDLSLRMKAAGLPFTLGPKKAHWVSLVVYFPLNKVPHGEFRAPWILKSKSQGKITLTPNEISLLAL